MAYRGLLGAREVVRVLLETVVVGVEDRHPPREARGVPVQVLLMGFPQAAARYPRVGDRDMRAGGRLHAVALCNLRETGDLGRVILDCVAEVLERRAGPRVISVPQLDRRRLRVKQRVRKVGLPPVCASAFALNFVRSGTNGLLEYNNIDLDGITSGRALARPRESY